MSDLSCAGSAGAEFEYERADEGDTTDGYGRRDGDVAVGVPHVGHGSRDEAVDREAEDAEKQAEAHARGGEEQRGKENP